MSAPFPERDPLGARATTAVEEEEEVKPEEAEARRSRTFDERLPRVLEASARLQAIMGVAPREGADTTIPVVPGNLPARRGPSLAEMPAGTFPFAPPFPPPGFLEREMHRRVQQQQQQKQQQHQQHQQRQRGPERVLKRQMQPAVEESSDVPKPPKIPKIVITPAPEDESK